MKAENHIGDTVGIVYYNSGAGFTDKRIGVITAVTVNKVILLLMDEDFEIVIPRKDINKICKPNEFKSIEVNLE